MMNVKLSSDTRLPYDNVKTTSKQMIKELTMFKEKGIVTQGFWKNYFIWVHSKMFKQQNEGLGIVKGNCLERIDIKDGSWQKFKIFTLDEKRNLNRDDVVLIAVFYKHRWFGMFKAFNEWITPEVAEVGTRYIDQGQDFNFAVPATAIFGIVER